MRALCGCIQSNLQHVILFSLCDRLLTWLIWSSFTFNIACTSSFLRSITCPCLSDVLMHCRHWIQEHFLNMESHLWLKVNWLQTTTFKLHHCFEAFAVLSLPSTKHQQRQRERNSVTQRGKSPEIIWLNLSRIILQQITVFNQPRWCLSDVSVYEDTSVSIAYIIRCYCVFQDICNK